MSTYAEQPFTEFEERYFLAEILKKSSLPPTALLAIIRDSGIEPGWNDIALPNGRSVSACQQAYQALWLRSTVGPSPQHPPPQLQAAPLDPSRRLKRPFSSLGDATTILPRELQPRPPSFASINGQPMAAPAPLVMSPIEPQRKKRGRPTKSEWERRQAEARERGEVWPKPRKPKARPSVDSAEGPRPGAREGTSPTGGREGQAGSGSARSPEAFSAAPATPVAAATHVAAGAHSAVASPPRNSPGGAEEIARQPQREERRVSESSPPDTQMADYSAPERAAPEGIRHYERPQQGSEAPQPSQHHYQHQATRESAPVDAPPPPSPLPPFGVSRIIEPQQSYQAPQAPQRTQVYQELQPSQGQQRSQEQQGQPGQQR